MEHRDEHAGRTYPGLAAGVLILNEKGEIFLMLRSQKTRNDKGMWSIPGGKVELNERVEDAVRRECLEECGVKLGDVENIGYVDHILSKEGQHWASVLFLAKTWSGEPRACEPEKCDAVMWCNAHNLPTHCSQVVFEAVRLLEYANVGH